MWALRDIIDTTPADGNVYKMLLGAVSEWFGDDCNPLLSGSRSGSTESMDIPQGYTLTTRESRQLSNQNGQDLPFMNEKDVYCSYQGAME